MVQDLHYIGGTFYRRDDRSGFKVRSYDTTKEWNGLWIRDDMAEGRQPQDFVRGVFDDQAAPEPRPTPTPAYLGPLTTTLSAAAAAGATALTVVSSVRMSIGDSVEVMCGTLDGAFQFRTTIANVPTTTSLTLSTGLPAGAASGNLVTDLTAATTVNASNYPGSSGNGAGGTGL